MERLCYRFSELKSLGPGERGIPVCRKCFVHSNTESDRVETWRVVIDDFFYCFKEVLDEARKTEPELSEAALRQWLESGGKTDFPGIYIYNSPVETTSSAG